MSRMIHSRFAALIAISGVVIPAGSAFCQQATADSSGTGMATAPALQEITVTATRQSQPLNRVPLSVAAFTSASMQELNVKTIGDLQAYTPGLAVQTSSVWYSTVALRGIRSLVGTSTTGVYIDDTPIQVRYVGYSSADLLPNVFDLQRVEVLRGPQGTLFGAGSEGGTVRFITQPPNMTQSSGFAESEGTFSDVASAGYDAGVAYGAPIIENELGFRASAWYRRTGGYIDSVDRITGATNGKDINHGQDKVAQFTLGIKPIENLTITPFVFFQEQDTHNAPEFWEWLSDPSANQFVTGKNVNEPVNDRFTLSSVKAEYDFSHYQLISVTSYFNREENLTVDFSSLFPVSYTGNPWIPGYPNYSVPAPLTNNQRNFTQEVRLQSAPGEGRRIDWTAGVFYTHNRQWSTEAMYDPNIDEFTETDFGTTALQMFGAPLYQGVYSVYFFNNDLDRQLAGFGQASWNITDKLKLTAGARVAHDQFSFNYWANGTYNAGYTASSGTDVENPVTEKAGLSYQIDPNKMAYIDVSKGYRMGGANTAISQTLCAQDLSNLGLKQMPNTYRSDYLWEYELGTKMKFFNRIQTDASVYYIRWMNIQQIEPLLTCGFQFITNLSSATSKGFDLSLTAQLTDSLSMNLAVGYTDAYYPDNTYGGTNPATGERTILFAKGDPLGVAPWNASIGLRYGFHAWGGKQGYIRTDYSYTSAYEQGSGPGTVSFDPALRPVQKMELLQAKVGLNITDAVQGFVFGDNLLNDAPLLLRQHIGYATVPGIPYNMNETIFPRTFGLGVNVDF